MKRHKRAVLTSLMVGSLSLGPLVGCESLPGGSKEQGAVIGGVGGALAGAAISEDNRGLGALIGGVLGAGGGWLIGAQKEKIDEEKRDEAIAANERAERSPASVKDVGSSRTADLNNDGFVTLDEVVAMERAGLSREEMIDRLEATGQIFELTSQHESYLLDRGVPTEVIQEMRYMNRGEERLAGDRDRLDERGRDFD